MFEIISASIRNKLSTVNENLADHPSIEATVLEYSIQRRVVTNQNIPRSEAQTFDFLPNNCANKTRVCSH